MSRIPYITIHPSRDLGFPQYKVYLDGAEVAQAWSELGAYAIAQRLRSKLNAE